MLFVPAAIASSRVDFPDPFSPTRKVTGCSKWISGSVRIAGTLKGNAWASRGKEDLSWTDRRWGMGVVLEWLHQECGC
jgi:hypothetical protein